MVVGVGRIDLLLPGNHSLKEKRKVLMKTLEKVRSRFDISIAEVGDHDLWQRAKLGFSVVGNNGSLVQSVMDRVVRYIDELHLSEVIGVETELLHFNYDRS